MRACVAERRLTFLVRQKTQASLRDAPIPITVTPWAKAHVYLHKPLRGLGRGDDRTREGRSSQKLRRTLGLSRAR